MRTAIVMAAVASLAACGGSNTSSNVPAPGAPESAKTQALQAGAAMLQDKPPIEAINRFRKLPSTS